LEPNHFAFGFAGWPCLLLKVNLAPVSLLNYLMKVAGHTVLRKIFSKDCSVDPSSISTRSLLLFRKKMILEWVHFFASPAKHCLEELS